MNLQTLAAVVFFLTAGVNYLYPHAYLRVAAGVSGVIVGLILLFAALGVE